jgi:hypothetical protein
MMGDNCQRVLAGAETIRITGFELWLELFHDIAEESMRATWPSSRATSHAFALDDDVFTDPGRTLHVGRNVVAQSFR